MEKLIPKYQNANKGKIQHKGTYNSNTNTYVDNTGNVFENVYYKGVSDKLTGKNDSIVTIGPWNTEYVIRNGRVGLPSTSGIDKKNNVENIITRYLKKWGIFSDEFSGESDRTQRKWKKS